MSSETLRPPEISPAARVVTLLLWILVVPVGISLIGWNIYSNTPWTTAPGREWLLPAAIVGVLAYCAYRLSGEILAPWRTHISALGVTRRTLRGSRTLLWRDISSLEVRGQQLILRGHGMAVPINLLWFAERESVLQFLSAAAPQAVVRAAA